MSSAVIQPGKYLALIGGEVANVEESAAAGEAVGGSSITDRILLSDVHPDVVNSLGGARPVAAGLSVGILETTTTVLLLDEGTSARQIVGQDPAPIRAVVVGIVDEVALAG